MVTWDSLRTEQGAELDLARGNVMGAMVDAGIDDQRATFLMAEIHRTYWAYMEARAALTGTHGAPPSSAP